MPVGLVADDLSSRRDDVPQGADGIADVVGKAADAVSRSGLAPEAVAGEHSRGQRIGAGRRQRPAAVDHGVGERPALHGAHRVGELDLAREPVAVAQGAARDRADPEERPPEKAGRFVGPDLDLAGASLQTFIIEARGRIAVLRARTRRVMVPGSLAHGVPVPPREAPHGVIERDDRIRAAAPQGVGVEEALALGRGRAARYQTDPEKQIKQSKAHRKSPSRRTVAQGA